MIIIAKSDLTIQLEKQIWKHTKKHLGLFGCFEVTIGWYGKERVDFMTYDSKGIFRCYEIKVSKSDFNSKAKLSFVGHYNYFVMPMELFEEVKEEIPNHIGVYALKGDKYRHLSCVKNPKKQELSVDEHILKDSMIRSLYREYERVVESDNPTTVERLRKRLAKAENKLDKIYRENTDLCNRLYRKYGSSWHDELYD